MKTRLLTTVFAVLVSAGVANAADLGVKVAPAPVPVLLPAYTWTGLYVGAQAGYSWNRDDWTNVLGGPNSEGFVIGGHIGYNYQINMLVVGLEGSFVYSDASGTDNCVPGFARCRTEHNWAGDVRARAGLAFDRALIYGAAGVAAEDVTLSVQSIFGNGKASETLWGYTLGAGVEYAVTNNIILGVEYKFSDFGTEKIRGVKLDSDSHKALFRASYKF